MQESQLRSILRNELRIVKGDIVCVHSALGFLNLDLDAKAVLQVLLETVGPSGTLIFPTYPGASYEFLSSNQVFDVRATSSAKSTGLLTDLAWQHPSALRSLHPTKSMAGIGPMSQTLLGTHQQCPFPYDYLSPYYKLSEHGAKIIGLGVWTYNLSFVHTVDDTMKEHFPFCPHAPQLFKSRCLDGQGIEQTIYSYAHDLKRMSYDTLHVQDFMKSHVAKEITDDFAVEDRRFFRVDAKKLYARMCELAEDGITIFKRAQGRTDAEKERELWLKLKDQVKDTGVNID